MTYGQIRFIKWVLLLLLFVSAGYVGYQVWVGVRGREASVGSSIEEPKTPVSRGVSIEQLDSEGRRAWTLKAAESTGRTETTQRFRDVEIHFEAGKEKIPVVVTGDRCEIGKDNAVYLEGNVVVHDNTSLKLEAATLHFRRYPDQVWSDDPVRYSRKGLRGTAGRMKYLLELGIVVLREGVEMTLQEEGDAPVSITSLSSKMKRGLHLAQFIDAVKVRQTNRSLDCNDLQVYFTEDDSEIQRMEAYENVDLQMEVRETEAEEEGPTEEPARVAASGLTSEPGTKRLLTDRLEVLYRPGGKFLERARAVEGGRLLVRLPDSASTGYDKELEGYTLAFEFDEQGRLQILRGRGGVTLVLTPRGAGDQPQKTITSRQLEATFDPETGDIIEAVCERTVTFEQGSVQATADLGTFLSAASLLVLEEQPRLWDEKTSLTADEIRIAVDTGNLEGRGSVRSTSTGSSEHGTMFPGGGKEPIYFVADHLTFDRASDLATYTGGARGLSGTNRIEARKIEIRQTKGELSALTNVRTVFLQKLRQDEAKPPAPTVTEAERFFYGSATEELQYRGGVTMRSEDMTLEGHRVDVALEAGGGDVEEIRSEGDVIIETTEGKALGENARYLPKDESMTVTGESARLENAGKVTEGKQLTFFLSDDKVFVDGREQTRTKTTYSSKPRL
jgi:LPS export ABC transporter protein LptC